MKLGGGILKGDGDFRSKESIEFLKEADIVCTNPPFSLFNQYIKQLIQYEKKFLIIGNAFSITSKDNYSFFIKNILYPGVNPRGMNFALRDDYYIKNGKKYKSVNAVWFTNMEHFKRNERIELIEKYNPTKYPKHVNYNAIEVSKVINIPIDYGGYMAVPSTFIYKYNPRQFQIIDANKIKTNPAVPFKPHGLIKDSHGIVEGRKKPIAPRFVIKHKNLPL